MSWNQAGESRYGVHSVDHFALEVPSLDDARRFFESFGLDVSSVGHGIALRAFGNPHVWARVEEGARKCMAYLSFNCWADEYQDLVAQIQAHGAPPAPAGRRADGNGYWFLDPDEPAPGQGRAEDHAHRPKPAVRDARRAGHRAVLTRGESSVVRPRRLSHVLLFSADINRSIAFYRDALGLRLSDRSRDVVAFMHGRHGSDHHLVAFAASSAKGWHHSAWDVDGVDEVGKGAEQMRKAGYTEGWGLGRHVLGSNYFYYVRDPWGSFAEYSADIDFVPTGMPWPAGDYPVEDSLYLWGPDTPAYFIHNSEA